MFGKPVADPLKPLQDEITDGKLGSFTVDRELDLNPTKIPATLSTISLSSGMMLPFFFLFSFFSFAEDC